MCYKTIKKEENLRNKCVLLASSTREKLAKAKEVRNELCNNKKYKRENLKGIFRHNERRNRNYSNNNIDKEKSYLNYSLDKKGNDIDKIACSEFWKAKDSYRQLQNAFYDYIVSKRKN